MTLSCLMTKPKSIRNLLAQISLIRQEKFCELSLAAIRNKLLIRRKI